MGRLVPAGNFDFATSKSFGLKAAVAQTITSAARAPRCLRLLDGEKAQATKKVEIVNEPPARPACSSSGLNS
jgi:hypothetical protein